MKLNTILCGPILRRTEPKQVCVWLAMSELPRKIIAKVTDVSTQNMVLVDTKDIKVPLGFNLYIILVLIKPQNPAGFKTGTPYSYDFEFQFESTKANSIRRRFKINQSKIHLSQLMEYKSISYTGSTPVFVIPTDEINNTQIFYGSCRKPHGKGQDAMLAADKFLKVHWIKYKMLKRNPPQMVSFFLGDQIYADDVEETLFEKIQDLSAKLMGYNETIPEYPGLPDLNYSNFAAFLDNYYTGRSGYDIKDINLLNDNQYFPNNSRNHRKENIIKCLESYYSTNYEFTKGYKPTIKKILFHKFRKGNISLINLMNQLLQQSGNSKSKIDLNEVLPRRFVLKANSRTKEIPVKKIKHGDRLAFIRRNASLTTTDHGHLMSFGEYAAMYIEVWGNAHGESNKNQATRRFLANVPSYMIFDDHDVTDDWNIDSIWRNRVEKSATGRRIISNALAAYFAFQGIGNAPDQFSSSFISHLTSHLYPIKPPIPFNSAINNAATYERALLGFDNWAFIAPTNPMSLFLDTRTMRRQNERMGYGTHLNAGKKYKAARLLSAKAYQKIKSLLNNSKFKKGKDPLIICAATPVLGSYLFEQGQLEFIDGTFNKKYTAVTQSKFKKPGRYGNDFENWKSNPRSKYDLLKFIDLIIEPSELFILSGDVHYAFQMDAELMNAKTGNKYKTHQLTSSAIKNNTVGDFKKINKLAWVSLLDTKDEKYKLLNETYWNPTTKKFMPEYVLIGKLVRYTQIIDEDSWLIPQNNIGHIEFHKGNKNINFSNIFLNINSQKEFKLSRKSTFQNIVLGVPVP